MQQRDINSTCFRLNLHVLVAAVKLPRMPQEIITKILTHRCTVWNIHSTLPHFGCPCVVCIHLQYE